MNKYGAKALEMASIKNMCGDGEHNLTSSIFFASTTNVKDTLKLYKDYDSVLSLGATGSVAYEALLNGASSVDMFDINYFQKVFYLYMQCAIKYLDYEDFIKHFTMLEDVNCFTKDNVKDIISHDLFDKLYSKLDVEVREVFGPLYDFYKDNSFLFSRLFRFNYCINLSYLKKYVSFYNKEEFYKLKELLFSKSLNYDVCDLKDLKSKKKFDLILLGNVLTFYKSTDLNTCERVNGFINETLLSMLSDNGAVQVGYLFGDGFEHFINNLHGKLNENPLKINEQMLHFYEEINFTLVKNYSSLYSGNIIPGVDGKSKNIILSRFLNR